MLRKISNTYTLPNQHIIDFFLLIPHNAKKYEKFICSPVKIATHKKFFMQFIKQTKDGKNMTKREKE